MSSINNDENQNENNYKQNSASNYNSNINADEINMKIKMKKKKKIAYLVGAQMKMIKIIIQVKKKRTIKIILKKMKI